MKQKILILLFFCFCLLSNFTIVKASALNSMDQKEKIDALYKKQSELYLDFNKNKISLYKYLPEKILENVVEFDIKDVNLYNLKLIRNGVNIISGDDEFVCYYPSKFKFKLPSNEQVILIDEEKVYISAWIEEDFDEENNCAGDNYKYYEKLVIRDFWGRFISEEIGNLNKAEDGNWWIS